MHWPVAFQPGEDNMPRDADGKILFDDADFTETYSVSSTKIGQEEVIEDDMIYLSYDDFFVLLL